MQKIRRRKFGEILVAEGLISREVLQDALGRQRGTGMTLGEILLASGVIVESDIVRCISSQYQLPYILTANYQYESSLLDSFGAKFLYKHKLIPLDKIGGCLLVAIAEIPLQAVEKALIERSGSSIYYYISPLSDVEGTLRKHFSMGQEQMLALDEERRKERAKIQSSKSGAIAAPPAPKNKNKLLQSLDSSWESIFDQAEENVQQSGD